MPRLRMIRIVGSSHMVELSIGYGYLICVNSHRDGGMSQRCCVTLVCAAIAANRFLATHDRPDISQLDRTRPHLKVIERN